MNDSTIASLVAGIKGYSVNIPSDSGAGVINAQWYQGKVDGFHEYSVWNGKNHINMKRKSLNMAKRVCEDWANLLLNEETFINVVSDEKKDEAFKQLLDELNFWVIGNEAIEMSFALGYGSLVLGVENVDIGDKGTIKANDDTRLRLSFIDRLKTIPITIDNGKVIEVAYNLKNSNGDHIILHLLNEDKEYDIHTFIYGEKDYKHVNVFNTKSKIPWFQIIRPFIANNKFILSNVRDVGISVFANSIDTLTAIDNKYDGFDLEYVLGRRRIIVQEELWEVHNKKDGSGKTKTFNPNDAVFQIMPKSHDNNGNPINDLASPLRADAFINGLNTDLNILSSNVGMGENHYRFDYKTGTPTATQIVSEQSSKYKTMRKHQILLEHALINLSLAIIEASDNFTSLKFGELSYQDIEVDFDDSIIEDTAAEQERDKGLVASGLMSPIEFRIKWMGEDEELATSNYRKYFKFDVINKYLPALAQGAITPKDFVLEVYGIEDKERIDYITKMLENANTSVFDMYDDLG